ncbi:MAG: RluA family pseudouridine synthase [Planctomycetota bacterium]
MTTLSILYEDNHLLIVNKPANLATMGDSDHPTLHSLAADYIKQKYRKPGKAFVGVVSRLDRVTTGVIVLARTSKAASRLSQQFQQSRTVRKTYVAMLSGQPTHQHGQWTDSVFKDDRAHRMRVAKKPDDGQKAVLRYRIIDAGADHTLAAFRLVTGRKHQIRLQCAHRGFPILGDRKYGSRHDWPSGVALHSLGLTIMHPTKSEPINVIAPPPHAWRRITKRTDWASIVDHPDLEADADPEDAC